MTCSKCESNRVASVYGKCSDLCVVNMNVGDEFVEKVGYVPYDMGIGGGDDISIDLCLDCGHVQGEWPLEPTELEEKANKSEDLTE